MDVTKIKKQLELSQKRQREEARKAQVLGARLTKAERTADTRRKILAGSWALAKAELSPEFNADMHRELSRLWLVRDDDRRLFGFDVLSETDKAAHPNAASIRRGKGRKQNPEAEMLPASASASLSEGFAPAAALAREAETA